MGFFNHGDDEDREQDESLERIERGGIPLGAEQRLRDLGAVGSMFTSGLSVNEFALLRRMGPQPIAQVMGASVVRTGYQYLPALPPGEIVSGGSGRGYYTTQCGGYVNRFTEMEPRAPGPPLLRLWSRRRRTPRFRGRGRSAAMTPPTMLAARARWE